VEKRGCICCKTRVVFGGTECFFSSRSFMIQKVGWFLYYAVSLVFTCTAIYHCPCPFCFIRTSLSHCNRFFYDCINAGSAESESQWLSTRQWGMSHKESL
jgi:hypothetical protein